MEKLKLFGLKVIYATLFCVVLPYLLWFWAKSTSVYIHLPVPNFPFVGAVLGLLGITMILLAMFDLWKKGKGLPMNAFPPKNYVKTGLYYFFHHPIYVGAFFFSIGSSLYFQSSSGLWLITPIFILMILSYVLGFENEIIARAFQQQKHTTFFDFPLKNYNRLSIKNRLLLYIWVFLPWILLYESFIFFGVPKDAVSTHVLIDSYVPFIEHSVVFYVLIYPLVFFIPFLIRDNITARSFIFDSIAGMILIFFCYLVFPFIVEYETLPYQENIFIHWIEVGRNLDGQTAALPSFHVFWALVFYRYYTKRNKNWRGVYFVISSLIILSCVTTKNHTVLDVVFGIIAYYLVVYREVIWLQIIQLSERISNSWKEWRIGKIRIINHGIYAGIAGFFGFIIIGYFIPNQLWIIYCIGFSGFIGAALWSQFIEGSANLLRPFGYYGSVIGMGITIILIALYTNYSFWFLLGTSTIAACIIQFFGRFRCLVQGCCHGKPVEHIQGIKFNHPKSRVNKLAQWKEKKLYPTQTYSIISNLLVFLVLTRLYSLEVPASFIGGTYLILSGIFRFLEESLRGEPQTPYFMGMRVYQWLAIVSIFVGISFTCIHSFPLPPGNLDCKLVLNAFIYGVIVTCVYGMDFPESNVRFSRLTQ